MRWSRQHIPTLKEVPQDAEIPSHQLMLRAGLIRRLSSGLYTFLPLGLKALQNVQRIIREEMNRAGALEVLMPAMQPKEIWEKTGRYDVLSEVMFSFQDRQERSMVLGPTHEEVITDLVAKEINSYRQLPVNFYQIQTKFRDEIRPRFGLMRAREFIMKDAYSFDADWEGVEASYQAMYEAYTRIFTRCGLNTKIVEADSGAMGGSASHEFMVLAEAGEDGVVECASCDYAANLEKAEGLSDSHPPFDGADQSPEEIHTPGQKTIEQVAAFLACGPEQLIKTLVYRAGEEFVAVLVPGDREVNELKLARVLETDGLVLANEGEVRAQTGAASGFAGPVGLNMRLVADLRLKGYAGAASGANKEDYHMLHVDLARDATVESYADITFARAGDHCPKCQGLLQEKRGIEVGHVFKLGTKYSEALGATFLDADGKPHPAIMGCYGIGVTRTLQSVIEQSHDQDGIIWPIAIAPYAVEVVILNVKHEGSVAVADQLVKELEANGIEVLLDDRPVRPGFKFKDADLVGLPIRIAIGEKSLAQGEVELKRRNEAEVQRVPVSEAAQAVQDAVKTLEAEVASC